MREKKEKKEKKEIFLDDECTICKYRKYRK